jgi:hypothetical protein
LGVVFINAIMVKEVIILGGFSQIRRRPFPNRFSGGVAEGCMEA